MVQVRGIFVIWSDSIWLKRVGSSRVFHWRVEGIIRKLTLAFCSLAVRGHWRLGLCKKGSHLPLQSLIDSPLPTLHFAPRLITSLPFKTLGKNLDLNTLKNKEFVLCSNLHVYLAKRASLNKDNSLNPMPPSDFGSHIFSYFT